MLAPSSGRATGIADGLDRIHDEQRRPTTSNRASEREAFSIARLDELIEEATVSRHHEVPDSGGRRPRKASVGREALQGKGERTCAQSSCVVANWLSMT